MRMIGTKMQATTNMMPRVFWLDTASHTVRLEAASRLDGKTKGNRAKPAVQMVPTIIRLLPMKVRPARRQVLARIASSAPTTPSTGAPIVSG